MTVRELIEKLQTMPQEATVVSLDTNLQGDYCIREINGADLVSVYQSKIDRKTYHFTRGDKAKMTPSVVARIS